MTCACRDYEIHYANGAIEVQYGHVDDCEAA
jgi:hypothetical protein